MKSFDEAWEKIHAKKIWGGYPSEYVIRFVARNYYNVPNRSDIKILDYGCGAGAHTWYCAREGFNTYAFDGSISAVNNTKERLLVENVVADVICADALELPYKAESFDAIIDSATIQANFSSDIQAMYKSCYTLLKDGGKLFSSVFGKDTDGYGTGTELEKGTYENLTSGRLQHTGRKHFFEENELRQILLDSGFKNITIDTVKYTDGGLLVHQYIAIAEK